jgi:hypothetical protein
MQNAGESRLLTSLKLQHEMKGHGILARDYCFLYISYSIHQRISPGLAIRSPWGSAIPNAKSRAYGEVFQWRIRFKS